MSQTLTKSRFIQGLGCPQKLVYGADKSYLNRSDDDSFLKSLARGGFQVGEFAKAHFPGGVDITNAQSSRGSCPDLASYWSASR